MKRRITLFVWVALAIIYLVINFLIPPDKPTLQRYHLTVNKLHFLDVTILLPVIVIWFLAYLGFIYISRYARGIASSKEGPAFNRISYGIMFFAFGLPIVGIISSAMKWVVYYHHGFLPTSTIISNYLSLVVPIVAFLLISNGISKIVRLYSIEISNFLSRLVIISLAILSITYTYLTFHQPKAALHAVNSAPNPYFLPTWLIMFTIVLPYVFLWSIGFISILQISIYSHRAKGILYRRALTYLGVGLAMVLFSYVAIEYLTSLTNKILLWHLGGLLAIVYALLLLLGVGYALIALGSQKLQKIEDV